MLGETKEKGKKKIIIKMRENSNISEYRNRLDKTLSSPDLTNVETLKILVKDQILNSSNIDSQEYIDRITEHRTKEVSNFLSMLRSASVNDEGSKHGDSSHHSWKVKQDTEEFRVMYREGPEGTPFHTLLVEGYVDGPADVCLCISCEASLYPKWWPQTTVPTFKITSSQCVKKVRTGEQICLVRMKVSWPLSAREALVHFFEFDYFQDGLVVVLLNSLPDLESIDVSTHGFTQDGVPDAQDVVRIEVVGGFAIQKVSQNRSYFRTIANMDIKLDFVPPAFINFISRQLIGSGFKLYKKEVASISKGSTDFGKALKDPVYVRVREALFPKEVSVVDPEPEAQMNGMFHPLEEQQVGEDEVRNTAEEVVNDNISNLQSEHSLVQDKSSYGEIEEIGEENLEESQGLDEDATESSNSPMNPSAKRFCPGNSKVFVRTEVEQALRTLDKAISFIKEHRSDDKTNSLPVIAIEESQDSKKDAAEEHPASGADKVCNTNVTSAQPFIKQDLETSNEPRNSSGSHNSRRGSSAYSRDTNTSKIAPASPDDDVSGLSETRDTAAAALFSSKNHAPGVTVVMEELILKEDSKVDSAQNENKTSRRMRTGISRYCCLNSFAWQLLA